LALSLVGAQTAIGLAVGSAYVADVVPSHSLGRGMALFNASSWVAAIVGFTMTGYSVEKVGIPVTFLLGAILAVVSVALLLGIQTARVHVSASQQP